MRSNKVNKANNDRADRIMAPIVLTITLVLGGGGMVGAFAANNAPAPAPVVEKVEEVSSQFGPHTTNFGSVSTGFGKIPTK